jgi:hypothetical protein
MMNEAAFANTRAAIVTVKFVAVANVIPAFTAFYGSIDELKHQTISLFELMLEKPSSDSSNPERCGLARFH